MVTDDIKAKYLLKSADKSHSLCIGIDPDQDRNGVAVWHRRKKVLIRLERMTTPETIALCCDLKEEAFIYLEAGHLINHVWGLNASYSIQKNGNIARKKGINNGFGLSIKQWLDHYLIAHAEVVPEGKKWTHEQFRQLTGWESKDQELIDAARLVVGR